MKIDTPTLERTSKILGTDGDPLKIPRRNVNARYDGADTNDGNELHWAAADNLDPHNSASSSVRRTLRSRSRYEVSENNPYLKGAVLTICNDFTGPGPKLQITDKRLTKEQRQKLEAVWKKYAKAIKLRNKLWRLRMAKIVDGEAFAFAFVNRRINNAVPIDWVLTEPEQIASPGMFTRKTLKDEIDGIRLDQFGEPMSYYRLRSHPGSNLMMMALGSKKLGDWIDSRHVVHWYRRDRAWVRGVPELAASFSLAALLRRTLMAYVQHEEIAGSIGGVIETDGPAATTTWTNDNQLVEDDPFDVFPIERGMLMNLPFGYKLKQYSLQPAGDQIDAFIGTVLRAILRPIGFPYNMGTGSSHESNMASAVVDTHLYRSTQESERTHCEEEVLETILEYWWEFARLIQGYLGGTYDDELPEHRWLWPRVGLDHTDPSRVSDAMVTLSERMLVTDRDIQETYYNRDVEEWRDEIREDQKFRQEVTPEPPAPAPGAPGEQKPGNKKSAQPAKKPAKK